MKTPEERLAQVMAAMDGADCTYRDGPDVRGCSLANRCWRCKYEASQEAVSCLERILLNEGGVDSAANRLVAFAITERNALRSALADAKEGFELELPGQWPQQFDKLLEQSKVDGPVYNLGRSEGRADVAVELRKIVDPDDLNHWDVDGTMAEVERLVAVEAAAKDLLDLLPLPSDEHTVHDYDSVADYETAEKERQAIEWLCKVTNDPRGI